MTYRHELPQLSGRPFATDGGMETTLIFGEGLDLPCFASFVLLETDAGRAAMRRYYEPYVALARDRGAGIILDTPTWRANPDWGTRLGYSGSALEDANRQAVVLVEEIRSEAGPGPPIVISGCVGPRGDGYSSSAWMSASEAEEYHSSQIAAFAGTATDMISALTLNYVEEAIGIARAARAAGIPVVISFTVETDGSLPSGQALKNAIEQVDSETDRAVVYFMVNCAHPTHFALVLEPGAAWVDRIGGLRANASRKSHVELDESDELDEGDPVELAAHYRALRPLLRRANVLGGCCGTDHRHVAEIYDQWTSAGVR